MKMHDNVSMYPPRTRAQFRRLLYKEYHCQRDTKKIVTRDKACLWTAALVIQQEKQTRMENYY